MNSCLLHSLLHSCVLRYEVMQFCWLQPEQRPVAEEVHLLLSYLCAKGMSKAEEDFEKRWNSLRPGQGGGSGSASPGASAGDLASSSVSSSFRHYFISKTPTEP